MSLLAPLFLLGALVVGVPIVAHLVRRATRERVFFSATQFLEPSPPRLDRRNRIEHPWLLLLRCLVVLALAAGFARPFLREAPPAADPATTPRHTVVIIDESASMRRGTLWDEALARTRTLASRLGAADRFALLVGGRSAGVLINSETWAATPPADRPALLETALAGRMPGWQSTHLDTAIDAAIEELVTMGDSAGSARESSIVVISDFTEGARISGLAGRDWPAGATLVFETLEPPAHPNASLHWLGWATQPDGRRAARLRLAHDRDAAAAYPIQLRTTSDNRPLGEPLTVSLAPREARAILVPVPEGAPAALRLELSGDDEPFDNTVWSIAPESPTHPLPYLGSGDAADPRAALFYVARATTGWREPAMTPQPLPPDATELPAAPLYLVAAPIANATSSRLRERLEAGSFALVLAHDATVLATAAALVGEAGWASPPAPGEGKDGAMFADIAFNHPLFAPFADPRFSDFTRVRFWRKTPIALPANSRATVVARFDDGAPAVLEVPVGRGTVVVWAGDWTPASSQWVLSTKFVPWFQALARRAAGGPPPPAMAEVGDATLPVRAPGVHMFEEDGRTRTVALNVPAIESRLAPLSLDAWESLGAPLATLAHQAPEAARAAAEREAIRAGSRAAALLEADQKLWRWLLLAAAALLGAESLVAIRAALRRAAPAATAA